MMNEKEIQRFNYTFEDGIWAMDQKPEGKWVRYSDHESALATARKEAFKEAGLIVRQLSLRAEKDPNRYITAAAFKNRAESALERAATTDTDNIRQVKEQKIK